MSGEANAYVAELRAERDRLREVVRRVEGLAHRDNAGLMIPAAAVRRALGSTDTGPAPAGAHAATQGAGDGV